MATIGRRLLPERDSMAGMLSDRSKMKFFSEAVIPPDSNLIGREVLDVKLFKREGVRLIDVMRGDASLRRNLKDVILQTGDRVVLRTQMAELLSLQATPELKRVDQVSAVETNTVEVLITPGCKMIGRSLGALRLRRRYGVYPLAVHRRNQNIGRQLDELVVRVGDTLLLEGAPEDIQRLAVGHGHGRREHTLPACLPARARPHCHRCTGGDRHSGGPRRGADPDARGDRGGCRAGDRLHRRG